MSAKHRLAKLQRACDLRWPVLPVYLPAQVAAAQTVLRAAAERDPAVVRTDGSVDLTRLSDNELQALLDALN
jgi:hypothetical protein